MSLSLILPNNPILWSVTNQVTDIPNQVLPHIEEMRSIMIEHNGIGLAAPQVGLSLAFFVTHDYVAVNPKIIGARGWNSSRQEGCLSFPGKTVYMTRKEIIDAEWTNENGMLVQKTLTMADARLFQHEFDHLAGKCIFNRPKSLDNF